MCAALEKATGTGVTEATKIVFEFPFTLDVTLTLFERDSWNNRRVAHGIAVKSHVILISRSNNESTLSHVGKFIFVVQ